MEGSLTMRVARRRRGSTPSRLDVSHALALQPVPLVRVRPARLSAPVSHMAHLPPLAATPQTPAQPDSTLVLLLAARSASSCTFALLAHGARLRDPRRLPVCRVPASAQPPRQSPRLSCSRSSATSACRAHHQPRVPGSARPAETEHAAGLSHRVAPTPCGLARTAPAASHQPTPPPAQHSVPRLARRWRAPFFPSLLLSRLGFVSLRTWHFLANL